MDSNKNNAPKEKEDITVKNSEPSKNFYPQPTPVKQSNEDIRRQLGWYLK